VCIERVAFHVCPNVKKPRLCQYSVVIWWNELFTVAWKAYSYEYKTSASLYAL
jgi:hypothetical protein